METMTETILDEHTLEQLTAMLGAEPPPRVQRVVAQVKGFADRIGSGAPLPAPVLALACLLAGQEVASARPEPIPAKPAAARKSAVDLAPGPEPKETDTDTPGRYEGMSLGTLKIIARERELSDEGGRAELLARLAEYDAKQE